jgi:hypothetical protein
MLIRRKKYFCKFQKVHNGSKKIENVFYFFMKDLLESNEIWFVNSKKSIFLYFMGLKITSDVNIEICGC